VAEKLKDPNLSEEQKTALINQALDAQKTIDNLQIGGRLLDMVAGGLSAPTDAAGGIIANALAPQAISMIGQYFKENDIRNAVDGGDRAGVGSTAHLIAHGLLAAAVSAAGGGTASDVVSSAIAAGGAEAAMPVLSNYLFGTEDSDSLTAEQKSTLSAIVGLAGAAAGVATGNASAIAQSSFAAQMAAENNWGEVGHYSTMATVLYLAGFSAQDAKAIALAAWAPDTDRRNAMSANSVGSASVVLGNQQSIHLLDSKVESISVQEKLTAHVRAILIVLKQYENDPVQKAAYLSRADVQNTLHSFGDSFAHVESDGTHYPPGTGHAGDSIRNNGASNPDDPSTNSRAYRNFALVLFDTASQVSNNTRAGRGTISNMLNGVISSGSKTSQQNTLANTIGRRPGLDTTGLTRSPVSECSAGVACSLIGVGGAVNGSINRTYGLSPK
jgi:filamentous hemagglutinin